MSGPAEPTGLDVEIVDTINRLYGRHPHARALHAKGLFCEGTFRASAEAGALCRAPHLQGSEVPVTIRFSTAGGDPGVHDGEREGRGMAVRFRPGGGEVSDLLCVTSPTFLVGTPEDFLELLRARMPDPETGAPDMEKVGAFLGAHPEAMPAVQANLGTEPPSSFARLAYNSLHAFRLLDAAGAGRWVRYRWEPELGEERIGDEEAKSRGPDHLRADLQARVAAGEAAFSLVLVLGEDSDPTDNPAAPWPEDRERVVAGRLEVTSLIADPESDGSIVVFDPTNVCDGIELPDDPILFARSRAYSVSAERRAG
ncbi:MAG: catalase family peroxidase [Solirubrobacterales bacterium]